VDAIKNREISFCVNIPAGKRSRLDSESIRRAILSYSVPYATTSEAAQAVVKAIESKINKGLTVKPIQKYFAE
jgi:carbamoyl-phosphate synthase large subunit